MDLGLRAILDRLSSMRGAEFFKDGELVDLARVMYHTPCVHQFDTMDGRFRDVARHIRSEGAYREFLFEEGLQVVNMRV